MYLPGASETPGRLTGPLNATVSSPRPWCVRAETSTASLNFGDCPPACTVPANWTTDSATAPISIILTFITPPMTSCAVPTSSVVMRGGKAERELA